MNEELENNIRNVLGNAKLSASGYYQIRCPVCNSKEIKSGFKFEPTKIIYNCFKGKCDASTEYVYGEPMYKKFKNLMGAFGVDIPLELKLNKNKPKIIEQLNGDLYEKHTYVNLKLPRDSDRYDPSYHHWFADLLEERQVTFNQQLYVGNEDPWKYKLIIPFYHNNKLIGWQGISEYNGKTFYLTSSDNTDIMFINTEGGFVPKNPIVVEGIMDAASIPNSIAVLGNSISKKQAYILRNSDPILLPDRKGSKFLKVAKQYGWRISIPDWKVKDVNDAVQSYGIFVAAKMIHDGIQSNILKAEIKYNLWKQK